MKTLSELGISPAPWKADGMYITSVHGTPIASVGVPMCESNDFADHRLILVAPDLYEALADAVGCVQRCSDAGIYEGRIKRYLAVLAKASGESEVAK